jgi:sulfatase maturation enzyme AslB (radical SAM superfamily)
MGHIKDADPLKLPKLFVANKPCSECKILGICGGRCLYTNIVKRWPDEVYSKVCCTIEKLIESVQKQLPRILKMIQEGKIELSDFDYLKFNGAEIIP